jgi:phage terminase large subunit-like protein
VNHQDGVLYASQVAKGEINVCANVRLACQRFLDQIERKDWEWYFDADYVEHVLSFAESLKHTKGPQAGEQIVL